MIAADTSSWIDFSKGIENKCSRQLESCLFNNTLMMPLPVLFEVLSGPGIMSEAEQLLVRLPKLRILEGFWVRAGELRRKLLSKGLKARSMDCLIAQNCIDNDAFLIASDPDFRHFKQYKLRLIF